ncbi:MAG: hypothetical protein ACQES8_07020 [Thermodesulfobacteriota bacterium]
MHNSAINLVSLHSFFVKKRGQKVSGARYRKRRLGLYKVIGVMAVLALLSGFAFSLWFGAHIGRNLRQLADVQQAVNQARTGNQELRQQKAMLFSKEYVQATAAVKLNLYPTKVRQTREDGVKIRL